MSQTTYIDFLCFFHSLCLPSPPIVQDRDGTFPGPNEDSLATFWPWGTCCVQNVQSHLWLCEFLTQYIHLKHPEKNSSAQNLDGWRPIVENLQTTGSGIHCFLGEIWVAMSEELLSLAHILVVVGRQPEGIRHGSERCKSSWCPVQQGRQPQATQQVVKEKWLVGECGVL